MSSAPSKESLSFSVPPAVSVAKPLSPSPDMAEKYVPSRGQPARHRVGAGIVLRLSGVNRWRDIAVHAASPVRILPRGDRTVGCPVQYCKTVSRQIATRNDIGYTSGRGDQGISTQRNRTVLRHRRQVGNSSETC